MTQRTRYERDRDEVLLGRAIDADDKEGDAFGKLARWSLVRALDELRRVQDKRPEPSLLVDFGCHYTEHRRYRMTNSWQELGLLVERGRKHIPALMSSRPNVR